MLVLRRSVVLGLAVIAGCGSDNDPPPRLDAALPAMLEDSGLADGVDAGPGESCVDTDDDGYGAGCAAGPDCDDGDDNVSPAAQEVCNGTDDDCDGAADEGLTGPSCALTEGVCRGAVRVCDGASGFGDCGGDAYGPDYEAEETRCDGMDNDCDGTTDEGCSCEEGSSQSCGSSEGACAAGSQPCTGGTWGACTGEIGPMGETCDGVDNDCDGTTDEPGELSPPACALQLGVCSGSARLCGGAAGWEACAGTASYGADYQSEETSCDGLDNDCDGVTDEGCDCVDGATQACGTDLGACSQGTQTCTAGSFGACEGAVLAAAELCDGVDNDCDGSPDEGLVAPPCVDQQGVCAGASQRCRGAMGFVACGPAEYGPNYQVEEAACDGLDNDCDGVTDEGCDCIDGTTQECGLAAGTCERGVQTCIAGEFGDCTGGVEPTAELCNGLDDDCNGVSDDGLRPLPCPLTQGVCADATQTCAGLSGWEACGGTASYGPRYLVNEDGAVDEGACDGLDNDCDGQADEGCTTSPIISNPQDDVLPHVFHQHLVYLTNADGNWDVVFNRLDSSAPGVRLTSTPEDEGPPRVFGNHVVFTRGAGANQRAVLYDLASGAETQLSRGQSGLPTIDQGLVIYAEFDGSQWDLFVYDIASGATSNLTGTPNEDELNPDLRGTRLAYVSGTGTGELRTTVADLVASPPVVIQQVPARSSAAGQLRPSLSLVGVTWMDGRALAAAPAAISPADDWNLYWGPFDSIPNFMAFPGENPITAAPGLQFLGNAEGGVVTYTDYSTGDANPVIHALGELNGTALSTLPATQADPVISGALAVWEDNRLGGFDIYGTFVQEVAVAPAPGRLVVNEVLARPTTDANQDGSVSSTADEFIEIANALNLPVDLTGVTVSTSAGVRHTFPPRTILPPGGFAVVFGGGSPAGLFAGATVQTASAGSLGIADSGDTVTLSLSGVTLETVSFGAEGAQPLHRSPELTGALVAMTAPTPGTAANGFAL